MKFSVSHIFDKSKQEGQKKLLLLINVLHFDDHSVLLPKEARMMQLEPNPSSIRHGVALAEFREFGMSRRETNKSKSTL